MRLNVTKRLALFYGYSVFSTQNRVIENYNITKITIPNITDISIFY